MANKHVDYALHAKRTRERNRDSQTARGGGSGIICVAPMLCSSIPSAPPDFSELLMFVISCITLEDSDWEKKLQKFIWDKY